MNRQLEQWAGDFGDKYVGRNQATQDAMNSRLTMWRKVLPHVMYSVPTDNGITTKRIPDNFSALEVGCNIGLNLRAIHTLLPGISLMAVEPNGEANRQLVDDGITKFADIWNIGVHELHKFIDNPMPRLSSPDAKADLVFTTGVLIHIHPDNLLEACTNIVNASRRYVYCCEYFSDQPREVEYRGKEGMMWTRDFGSYYLDNFPELECIAHGFFWRRTTGLDNSNWWLMEKKGTK